MWKVPTEQLVKLINGEVSYESCKPFLKTDPDQPPKSAEEKRRRKNLKKKFQRQTKKINKMFEDCDPLKEDWMKEDEEPLNASLDFSEDEFAEELQQFALRLSQKKERETKQTPNLSREWLASLKGI